MKMPISTVGKARINKERGFTYVMVLVAVVVVGLLVGVGHEVTSRIVQADREAELIFRGLAYKNAIKRYHTTNQAFPRSLEDLLKDPNRAHKRYLRSLYVDPMAKGEQTWTLMRAANGGISGVASSGTDTPIKQANFPKEMESFAGAQSYSDWVFEYVPKQMPTRIKPGQQKSS